MDGNRKELEQDGFTKSEPGPLLKFVPILSPNLSETSHSHQIEQVSKKIRKQHTQKIPKASAEAFPTYTKVIRKLNTTNTKRHDARVANCVNSLLTGQAPHSETSEIGPRKRPSNPHSTNFPHAESPGVQPRKKSFTQQFSLTSDLVRKENSEERSLQGKCEVVVSEKLPCGGPDLAKDNLSAVISKPTGGAAKDINVSRVDILSLKVVDCPLQKNGRNTIICGRLPDDNQFAMAARDLGRRLVSKRHFSTTSSSVIITFIERRRNFYKDWTAFYEELHGFVPKLPVIGGGELDIFLLIHEVLLLGGVLSVLKKRALRIVGQQLELPKSCTSAASILKNAYENLLFYYEQKLVLDRMPKDITVKIDMKSLALLEKEKERRMAEKIARLIISKKRSVGTVDLLIDIGDCRDIVQDGYLNKNDLLLKRILIAVSERPETTLKHIEVLIDDDEDEFEMPIWTENPERMTDDAFQVLLREVQEKSENRNSKFFSVHHPVCHNQSH